MSIRKSPKSVSLPLGSHPMWGNWAADCGFLTVQDARNALGISNGAFYRTIRKPPSLAMRYAMRAVYHRDPPYGA